MVSILVAIARFCEAIIDYLADEQRASSGQVQASQFEGQIFSTFEHLFNVWLVSKEAKVYTCIRIDKVHEFMYMYMCTVLGGTAYYYDTLATVQCS